MSMAEALKATHSQPPSVITLQGPATMKVVEVQGLAYEIGLAMGQQTQADIRTHLDAFADHLRIHDDAWVRRRDTLVQTLQRHVPQSLAELRGLADGSGVPFDALLWLNTEPSYGQSDASIDRCSNLVFAQGPDGPIWGKNNDRPAAEAARPVCAKVVHRVGQQPVVVFTYAGLLATADGMNAAGLCVGHSSVGSVFEQSDDHVPIRLWAYEGLFTCRTTEAFVRHMKARPLRGKGYALVCVDESGDAVAIEAPCPLVQVRRPHHDARHVQCVNLYQLPSLAHADRRTEAGKCNAQARRAWLDNELASDAPADLPRMQRVLRHDQEPGAICRRAQAPDTSMTEFSMIGLPARRQAMFLYGDPGSQAYQTLTFHPPADQPAVSPAASHTAQAGTTGTLELEPLRQSMRLACQWMQDVAQLPSDALPADTLNTMGFGYTRWQGALRGEYSGATGQWSFFCPVWHTGQAVKALTLAAQVLDEPAYLRGAQAGKAFLLNHQVWDTSDPDHGLLLAFEDEPDQVNTSAVLEAMDGLLILADHEGDDDLRQRVVAMGDFLLRRMYMPGMGLFRDLYHPASRQLGSPVRFRSKENIGGRPLLDDAILLKLHHHTGQAKFLEAHLEIAHRLVADQNPAGNWLDYGPCDNRTGRFHPRHTYWWGLPLIDTWLHTGEQAFLDTAIAAGEFARQAMRADGGYIRGTQLGFNTDSFGHATSGSACAAILFMRLFEVTGHAHWLASAELALRFCMNMQLADAQDPNLRGAILEKVLPPDGTDRLPYHLRDLGTIFFVSAGAAYLTLTQRQTSQATA